MTAYSAREMMAIAAAREIRGEDIIFCGTGISMLAAMAAKQISAPQSLLFFETGAIDAHPVALPMAVGDPRVLQGAAMGMSLGDTFAAMQNRFSGARMVAILGAAQIDRFGNLNTTVIGPLQRPVRRLPGSGGACDAAAFVERILIFMTHDKHKFVSKLDYRTSPGWMDGPGSREKAGLPGGGPERVITDLGILEFDGNSREMFLAGCYPGVSARQVQERTGFSLDLSRAGAVAPPTREELRILRSIGDARQRVAGGIRNP